MVDRLSSQRDRDRRKLDRSMVQKMVDQEDKLDEASRR